MTELNPKTLEEITERVFTHSGFVEAHLRNPRLSAPEKLQKADVRPVTVRGAARFQFSLQRGQKQTHENLNATEAAARLLSLLNQTFGQATLFTAEADWRISLAPGRPPKIRRTPPTRSVLPIPKHDRRKDYLFDNDVPPPFLVQLGLTAQDGRPIAARRNKLKQIQRFLEWVGDALKEMERRKGLERKGPLRVVDFGCGKGYLTFALYHALTELKDIPAEIIGVDLKADVIGELNEMACGLGYQGLKFQVGSIADFTEWAEADLVMALHACDTATDDALLKAVSLNAEMIFAAPCCPHELSGQLQNETMKPLLKHGILRERLAALITDAARAELLSAQGYTVQLIEFVDPEHTPKNLLIRAVRERNTPRTGAKTGSSLVSEEWRAFREFWHIRPALERGLEGDPPAAPTCTVPFLENGDGEN